MSASAMTASRTVRLQKAMWHTIVHSTGRVAALIAFAFCMKYAFGLQKSVGGVNGRIVFGDTRQPAEGASVTLDQAFSGSNSNDNDFDEVQPRLHVTTNDDGTFHLTQVPVGTYNVSSYLSHHKVDQAIINVSEGGETPLTLTMTRTEPEFALAQHQRSFGTTDEIEIPVNGYTQGKVDSDHDEMSVKVYKTRVSEVMRDPASAGALTLLSNYAYRGSSAQSMELPSDLIKPKGRPVATREPDATHRITTADKEGFFYERIKLGKRPPGMYLVEVTHGKIAVSTWVLVTDMALVLKEDSKSTLAWAVGIKSGLPVAGAEIRTYRGLKTLKSVKTGTDGTAMTTKVKAGDDSKVRDLTVAVKGDDECLVRKPENERSESEGDYKVHVYTERPIYRPGQKIYFKGILRRAVVPGSKYTIPTTSPVDVEVDDPGGERIFKKRLTSSSFGSFTFDVDLTNESRTGVYTVVSRIGNTNNTSDFVVASYRKPEFEVKLAPKKPRYLVGESIEVEVSGEYYFGSPMAGAKVDYYAYSRADYGAWDPDYDENDDSFGGRRERGSYDYMGRSDRKGSVVLDKNGKATIKIKPQFKNRTESPQDRVISITASVTDDSERNAESKIEVKMSAGEYHLTVMPDGYLAFPGKPTTVQVRAVRDDGSPVKGLTIHLAANREIWKENESTQKPVSAADAVTDDAGIARIPVTPNKAGSIQLEATARDTGNRVLRADNYLWCSGDVGEDMGTEGGDLTLLSDKRSYNPGDSARLLISSKNVGQLVLLTVEGDHLFKALTLPISDKATVYNLPILKDYGPNVFLNATYVKNKKFATSQIGLRVSNAERTIKVSVTPDRPIKAGEKLASFHPRDKVGYSVLTTDVKGNPVPAEFSLAVVDESIYALREDNPKAIEKVFYPRRINEVRTSYSFEAEYLGDADKAEPKIAARKKFPDTAYWNPNLTTDATGKAHVMVDLPDNLTTWRATAVAQTRDTAFGYTSCKVMSTIDFSVRLEVPRYLTWRDRSVIQATVHNNTAEAVTSYVKLVGTGVAVEGDATQKVQVAAKGSAHVEWKIATQELENASFDVTAWTPKSAGPQLADRMQLTIPMRPHGRDEITRVGGEITSGSQAEVFRLDSNGDVKSAALTIRVDPSVAASLGGGLQYLVGFPYGCTEQTMSRFLPDILAKRIQGSVHGLNGLPTGAVWNDMLQKGLIRLGKFQHRTGAWGWWETDADDVWMTSYVLVGLSEAKASGLRINNQVLDKGVTAATALLSKADEYQMPFLLYALASTGQKEALQKVNILRTTMKTTTLEGNSIAFLLLADNLIHRDKAPMLARLRQLAVVENGMRHWKGKDKWGWEDERLSTAVALRAEIAGGAPETEILETLRWLMIHRTGEYWGDTRSTCWVIMALCDYLKVHPESANPSGEITVNLNSTAVTTIRLADVDPQHPEMVYRLPAGRLKAGKNDVQLVRTGGSGAAFYSMEMRQLINHENLGELINPNLTVKREYFRLVPKQSGTDHITLEPELIKGDMKPGENIRVKLTLTAKKDLEYMLIEDPMPAGCEPNERGAPDELSDWGYWWSSIDIRDNRVAFFARSIPKGNSVIEYNLRAMTVGNYHVMPTLAQPMYDPAVTAYSAEAHVNVR